MSKTLMPDVMVPEAHQNNHSYVCELSGLTFDSLHNNLAWWAVTWRVSKNPQNCQNWGVGACSGQYSNGLEVSQKWIDS